MPEEKVTNASAYVAKFLFHLQEVTGFDKKSFTRAGLQANLKAVAKRFYQLDISGKALQCIFELVKLLTSAMNNGMENLEKCITVFMNLLHAVANFLFCTYVGQQVLFITVSASNAMTAFVTGLFYVAWFVFNHFSGWCFLKLKELIMCFFHSEKTQKFFEEVFGTYGRAITIG